jgi:hypothetical protein
MKRTLYKKCSRIEAETNIQQFKDLLLATPHYILYPKFPFYCDAFNLMFLPKLLQQYKIKLHKGQKYFRTENKKESLIGLIAIYLDNYVNNTHVKLSNVSPTIPGIFLMCSIS